MPTKWKTALMNILEELTENQFEKLKHLLTEIPKGRKETKSRPEMAQTIIEHYGEKKSITRISEAMEEVCRRDAAVQDQLRPFVKQLKKKPGLKKKAERDPDDDDGDKTGKKRRRSGRCSAPEKKKTISSDGFEKNNTVTDSDSSEDEAEEVDPESPQPEKKTEIPSWRIGIKLLKKSGSTNGKPVGGKVAQKSGLRTYETKKKEKKFFFYLGVADETDCIKVMVYGKERYHGFEKGRLYNFRDVVMEVVHGEKIMKVLNDSEFTKTSKIEVTEAMELQAQMLIYSQHPVCSVEKIQRFDDKTPVSVEGTVTEINPPQLVKVKGKRLKQPIQKLRLIDGTGSIRITLWRRDVDQLRGTSVGDLVRVTNVRTNCYCGPVSLNSTDSTRIYKVQGAAIQTVTMEIIGIKQCGKMESELEVATNNQTSIFIAASPLLAKLLGIRLNGDFEEKLLEKIPFSVEAQIKGNKITKLTAAKEM